MVHDHGKEEGVGGGCASSHTKRRKLLPLMFVYFDASGILDNHLFIAARNLLACVFGKLAI